MILDDGTTALVTAGSALIVGTVDAHGMPHACRAWGLDVLDRSGAGGARLRVLLDDGDDVALANLAHGRPIAITAADVPSLRSAQVKGVAVGSEACGPEDRERMRRYVDAFFGDVVATEGTSRHVLDRLVPDGVVAVLVDVTEVFDQTPGPAAGRAVAPGAMEGDGG